MTPNQVSVFQATSSVSAAQLALVLKSALIILAFIWAAWVLTMKIRAIFHGGQLDSLDISWSVFTVAAVVTLFLVVIN